MYIESERKLYCDGCGHIIVRGIHEVVRDVHPLDRGWVLQLWWHKGCYVKAQAKKLAKAATSEPQSISSWGIHG